MESLLESATRSTDATSDRDPTQGVNRLTGSVAKHLVYRCRKIPVVQYSATWSKAGCRKFRSRECRTNGLSGARGFHRLPKAAGLGSPSSSSIPWDQGQGPHEHIGEAGHRFRTLIPRYRGAGREKSDFSRCRKYRLLFYSQHFDFELYFVFNGFITQSFDIEKCGRVVANIPKVALNRECA
jgi:hypothetical protein